MPKVMLNPKQLDMEAIAHEIFAGPCVHCNCMRDDHADDKCLFGSTRYKGEFDDLLRAALKRVAAEEKK